MNRDTDTILSEKYGSPVSLIGKGTFSNVYLFKKEKESANFAVKLILFEDINVLREIIIIASVKHPNITKPIDIAFDIANTRIFLVFPKYVNSLWGMVDVLGFQDKRQILFDVATALMECKKNKILHLDISPKNILIERDGSSFRGILGDFGLSQVLTEDNENITGKFYIPWYRPPELIMGTGANYYSDIWAFGCMCYHIMVGKPLFDRRDDVELLVNIFSIRGIPTKFVRLDDLCDNYINARKRVDNTLDNFYYNELFLPDGSFELIEGCVRLEPERRIIIENVLKCDFFQGFTCKNVGKTKVSPRKRMNETLFLEFANKANISTLSPLEKEMFNLFNEYLIGKRIPLNIKREIYRACRNIVLIKYNIPLKTDDYADILQIERVLNSSNNR